MEDKAKAKCGTELFWHNCYSGGFSLWSENAYSHPAKMSPALCYRILQHLQELGLVKEGDTILDPMAGIGTTNVCAGAMGFKSISVELEEKFVNLQKENKEYAERKLYKSLDWTMVKGDSRKLSSLLTGNALKSVTSPPYGDQVIKDGQRLASNPDIHWREWDRGTKYNLDNPDNIGNLKDTPLKSITSPPYMDALNPDHTADLEVRRLEIAKEKGISPDKVSHLDYTKAVKSEGYRAEVGQIGNLKDTPLKSITSPPYQDNQGHPSLGSVNKDDWGKEGKDIVKRRGLSGKYGESEGQVGNLKSITSPPYEESLPNGLDRKAAEQMVQAMYDKHGRTYSKEDFEYQVELILKRSNREYGDAEGQIGKLKDKPLKSIVSPPYSEAQSGGGIAKKGYTGSKHSPTDLVGNRSYMPEVHGQSEGQIANLKDTPLKAITSPPYGIDKTSGGLNTKPPRDEKDQAGRSPNSPSQAGAKDGYGETEGQIGALKDTPLKSIVSPPYGETGVGDWKTGRAEFQAWVINEIKTKGYVEWRGKRYTEAEWRAMNHGRIDGRTTKGVHKHPTDGYSDNPDNIGGLPDKPLKAIVSPPYEQSITGGKSGIEWQEEWGKPSESRQPSQDISYGESKENIGNLKDKPLKSIVSPPYGDAEKRDRSKEVSNEKERDYPRGDHNISAGYQGSDDNIGKLTDKPLESVVSPPYADSNIRRGDKAFDTVVAGESREYSKDPNNIGNLSDKPLKSVMSPPHGLGKGVGHADKKRDTRPILKDRNVNLAYNDKNPNNIGNLADKPLKSIVSPPYDKNVVDRYDRVDDNRLHKEKGIAMNYGRSEGQVAQEGQESYLSAMKKVYSEIALVSDVLCVVVKNPTRNGKIRRLDSDTISILEASGWRIFCQHRALLFEELEQADMFQGSKKQVKGRLSFFKRLSWQNGNPVATFEDVIIAIRK